MENKNFILAAYSKYVSKQLRILEKKSVLDIKYNSLFLSNLEEEIQKKYEIYKLKVSISEGRMRIIILELHENRERETVGTEIKRQYRKLRRLDAEDGHIIH